MSTTSEYAYGLPPPGGFHAYRPIVVAADLDALQGPLQGVVRELLPGHRRGRSRVAERNAARTAERSESVRTPAKGVFCRRSADSGVGEQSTSRMASTGPARRVSHSRSCTEARPRGWAAVMTGRHGRVLTGGQEVGSSNLPSPTRKCWSEALSGACSALALGDFRCRDQQSFS